MFLVWTNYQYYWWKQKWTSGSHSFKESSPGLSRSRIRSGTARRDNQWELYRSTVYHSSKCDDVRWWHHQRGTRCVNAFLRSAAGSLVEDIGEMILQLRRQVEGLFSIKYGKLAVAAPSGSIKDAGRLGYTPCARHVHAMYPCTASEVLSFYSLF